MLFFVQKFQLTTNLILSFRALCMMLISVMITFNHIIYGLLSSVYHMGGLHGPPLKRVFRRLDNHEDWSQKMIINVNGFTNAYMQSQCVKICMHLGTRKLSPISVFILNVHNCLINGQNELALSIMSVFWQALGGLFSLFS